VLDSGSVEIRPDGSIGAVSSARARGKNVIDAQGKLLMPALINCHTHLYSTLARGISLPGRAPRNFPRFCRSSGGASIAR
jgi:cytosine/adenosine deaminase-related metal-dependent hydrolase